MRYFLNTQFIEDGLTIDMISIGIRCEDGRKFYRVNAECDFSKASTWVKTHVLGQMGLDGSPEEVSEILKKIGASSRKDIRSDVLEFIRHHDERPEFWAYYADYHWVAFCQLFGRMIELPDGFPMYCNDLKQLLNSKGNPLIQHGINQNALENAEWCYQSWKAIDRESAE